MPSCPKCGGELTLLRKGGSLCEDCRTAVEPVPPLPLDRFPSVLAIPLALYQEETHPVLRLWHACDAVELTLRLLVALALGDLRRRGPVPRSVLEELPPRIGEPTLGKWKIMAAVLAQHLDGAAAVPELPGLVRETLVPLLDGPRGAPRTAETSFTVLRNQLAHGGGVTRAVAARLVAAWDFPVTEAFRKAAWLAEVDLVVRTADGTPGVLRGPTNRPAPYTFADRRAGERGLGAAEDVVLVRGAAVMPAWPLKLYGPPRSPDPDAPPAREAVPQVYVRRGEVRLQFTPVGSEEVCQSEADEAASDAFLALFRFEDAGPDQPRAFTVAGFEADVRKDADRLVGRSAELATLRAALADVPPGLFWLWGAAGAGKSYLVAGLAQEMLDDPPAQTRVLPYRFKVGDDRCSRDSFLRFALERLKGWPEHPPAADPNAKLVEQLERSLRGLGGRRVLFLLDGLDEVAGRDPSFAEEVVLRLAAAGGTWLCAGRPERGLPEVFRPDRCREVFPAGVPPMSAADVRTLLLERIGSLRTRLLRNDREEGERILNPFIERVAAAAAGLPLYVSYVVGDVLGNRFRALDAGERLPPSLSAYHEELLRRCAIGTLQQVLTPLATTLAVALEPLTAASLAELLRRRTLAPPGEAGLGLTNRGLAAIASMLRRAFTPEGEEGYTLFHHSLRQHMAESERTREAVALARASLTDAARCWADAGATGGGPLQTYFRRSAAVHLLDADDLDRCLGLLVRLLPTPVRQTKHWRTPYFREGMFIDTGIGSRVLDLYRDRHPDAPPPRMVGESGLGEMEMMYPAAGSWAWNQEKYAKQGDRPARCYVYLCLYREMGEDIYALSYYLQPMGMDLFCRAEDTLLWIAKDLGLPTW